MLFTTDAEIGFVMPNQHQWLEDRLKEEDIPTPSVMTGLLRRKKPNQGYFHFMSEEESETATKEVNSTSSSHRVIAIARRGDQDGVVCVMLEDPSFPRGSVLTLDDDRPRDYEVDDAYPSLQAWAEDAEQDIADRIRAGQNEPYDE